MSVSAFYGCTGRKVEMMTIWEFLEPIVGVDIRFPVEVIFLFSAFTWSWSISRSWIIALAIAVVDAFLMRWFPGMVMAGTYTALGCVQLVLAAINFHYTRPDVAAKTPQNQEYLPDGALVGYKWLNRYHVFGNGSQSCLWSSPAAGAAWEQDELTADKEPEIWNSHGIYIYYSIETAKQTIYNKSGLGLVKLACDGKVVYHENGARVQRAEIVSVVMAGGQLCRI
jgi:hypothetical protein